MTGTKGNLFIIGELEGKTGKPITWKDANFIGYAYKKQSTAKSVDQTLAELSQKITETGSASPKQQ